MIYRSQHTLAFLFGDYMIDIFETGQYVYTAKDIRGWFDHSVKSYIPRNTVGVIAKVVHSSQNLDEVVYSVKFDKEFGQVDIHHNDLKTSVSNAS